MKKYLVLGVILMMTALTFYSCKEEIPQPAFQEEEKEMDLTKLSPAVQNFFQFDYASKYLFTARNQHLITLGSQTYEFRPSTLDAYNEVRRMIYHQELKKPFLEKLVREDGHPIWDRSINFTGGKTQMFYIVPFARKNEAEISSILLVTRYLNKVQFHYWKKSDLRQLLGKKPVLKSDIGFVEITLAANSWTFGAQEEILNRVLVELKRKPKGGGGRCGFHSRISYAYEWVACPRAKMVNGERCDYWKKYPIFVYYISADCGGEGGFGGGGGGGGTPPGNGWPGGSTPPQSNGSGTVGNVVRDYLSGLDKGKKDKGGVELYLIPEFGEKYQYTFSFKERKWLKANTAVLNQIAQYIKANQPLSKEQVNYIKLHAALAMNEPSFNQNLAIGEFAWFSEILDNDWGYEVATNLDTISLPNDLDSFPCIRSGLEQFGSLNDSLANLIHNIFDKNNNVHIHFRAVPSLGTASGHTKTKIDPITNDLIFLIELNTHKLENYSRDYAFAIIIHECLHAYMNYYFETIGSSGAYPSFQAFKEDFPLYDAYTEGHETMVNKYLNSLASSSVAANPNLTELEAMALAWGGLYPKYGKERWESLGADTTQIKYLMLAAKMPNYVDVANNFVPCNN